MSISGAVAAATRNTNQYSEYFNAGARFVLDFLGTKSGKPFYGLNNRVYPNIQSIPGYTFSRASEAIAEGLVNDVVTNKVTCWSANPTETAGFVGTPANMTRGGDIAAVISVVDDSATLTVAGLSGICTSGKVYKIDNSLGVGAAYVYMSGDSGNTNNHIISAWARATTGTGAIFGSGLGVGTISSVTSAAYLRRVVSGPAGSAFVRAQVQAQAGSVVYFILPQLIERPAPIAQDIVTQGAAASNQSASPPIRTDRHK